METNSARAFAQAQQVIPGGVNSPARAFGAVGGGPRFIDRGVGSRIFDIDGREYIDYVCSWGPLIFGHAHPRVVKAVQEACAKGTSFGAPTELEIALAERIVKMVSSIEMVRMVSSGTEATMAAVRLARGHTGRDKIAKFEGCWHGHGDSFLSEAGSSALTLGVPTSPGVPQSVVDSTLTLPYNDADAVRAAVRENSGQIAAIIVEPVAGNMGTVPPREGFLPALRQIADEEGYRPHLRRGHYRVPRRSRRGARALWRDARLDVLGQNCRGGLAGCGVWRQAGNHGKRVAAGHQGLASWHLIGQPARYGRGLGAIDHAVRTRSL